MEHRPTVEGGAAFCSWSGGKDSCLALDRVIRTGSYTSITLYTMLREGEGVTGAHGLPLALLERQASALGLPFRAGYAGDADYELRWSEGLRELAGAGVSSGIFGDIDVQAHYDWIGRVLGGLGLAMVMPLWHESRDAVVDEFVARGYRARIVSVREGVLDRRWLGAELDAETVAALRAEGVDASGEGGEFHSFVWDGPAFRQPVDYAVAGERSDGRYRFLELA